MLAWPESTALATSPAALARTLADAAAGGGAFAPSRLAGVDGREEFPDLECALLDEWGLASAYVPTRFGGALSDFADLVARFRTVARHDLTTAVAHGKTFLGSACMWVAGRPDQAAALAAAIAGGDAVCWGLTEPGHGSDLLAGEVTARADGESWVLDGVKWMVNNATRARLVCVLARTSAEGGPRGFSLFLVDKAVLAASAYECLPKIRTHGVRGADISGIAFRSARLSAAGLVGPVGGGFETVLKALQLTRVFSVGLSLGAADHALALAVRFARDRLLYGRRLTDLPRVRRVLGEAAARILVAEATCLVACRAAHALPGELPAVSAVTKALVPTLVHGAIGALTELLGARGFLTGVYADGAFAKLERDHRVVGIFDGSTLVNRSALIGHFPALARSTRADRSGLAAVATTVPLSDVDWSGLRLSPSGCSVMRALPDTAARVRALADRGLAPESLAASALRLIAHADAVHAEIGTPFGAPVDVPASAFRLAERYELCFAGAACLAIWAHNTESRAGALWRDALWTRAAMAVVLAQLDGVPIDDAACDELADVLIAHDPGDGPLLALDRDGGEGDR